MANEAIGHVKCPWCSSKRMRVALDKGGKICVTCSACHFQGFARGALSDMSIRQAMTPVERMPAPPEPPQGQAIEVPGALEAAGGVPKPVRQVRAKAPAAEQEEGAPVVPAPEGKKKGFFDIW